MLHSHLSDGHTQEALAALAVLENASNNYVFCPLDTSTNKRIVLSVIFMTLYPVRGKIEPCWPDLDCLFVVRVWSFPWHWLVRGSDCLFPCFLALPHGRCMNTGWLERGSDMSCIHTSGCGIAYTCVCWLWDCMHVLFVLYTHVCWTLGIACIHPCLFGHWPVCEWDLGVLASGRRSDDGGSNHCLLHHAACAIILS